MNWIKWNGDKQPVADDQVVTVELRGGKTMTNQARAFIWSHCWDSSDIIEYYVHQEETEGLVIQPEQLRELMKATGLSQSEIAGKLYTSLGTLKEWLAGNNLGSTGQKANYNARCELLALKIKDGSLTDARRMVEELGL